MKPNLKNFLLFIAKAFSYLLQLFVWLHFGVFIHFEMQKIPTNKRQKFEI